MTTVEFGKELNNEICLALGYFDGVHFGHRIILEKVKERAAECGAAAAVSTFADSPNKSDSLLGYNDRKKLFSDLGMEYCVSLYYVRECNKTGEDFFKELIGAYRIRELVCGEDYRFGCDHIGVTELERLCFAAKIKLNVVKLCDLDGVRVSCTAIKVLLRSGKLSLANKMLVTPYHISGRIVSGQGIGRNIGMPTVNIHQPAGLFPIKHGVYGTIVKLNGKQYNAVTNYGAKPTFDMSAVAIESHLMGYDGGSLLGEDITVFFVKYIRTIRKFKNAEELVEQINKDMRWRENAKNRP